MGSVVKSASLLPHPRLLTIFPHGHMLVEAALRALHGTVLVVITLLPLITTTVTADTYRARPSHGPGTHCWLGAVCCNYYLFLTSEEITMSRANFSKDA